MDNLLSILRRLPRYTLLQWLLLLILLFSLLSGVLEAGPQLNLANLSAAGLLGLLLAWWLAGRPTRRRAVLSAAAGAVWCVDQAAGLHPVALRLLAAWLSWLAGAGRAGLIFAWQTLAARPANAAPPDWPTWPAMGQMIGLWNDLSLRMSALSSRSAAWLTGLRAGKPTADDLVIGLAWALLVWGVAAWAGWWARRGLEANPPHPGSRADAAQALKAGLPALVVLSAVLAVNRLSFVPLLFALAAVLGLQALNSDAQRSRDWQRRQVDSAGGLSFELSLWAAALGFGTLALAALLAQPSPAQIIRRLSQPEGDQPEAGVALQPPAATERPVNPGILPRRHMIGAGPELSQRVVMMVQVSSPISATPGSLYWSGVTYDVYTGQGWYTSYIRQQDFAAGASLPGQAAAGLPLEVRVQMVTSKEQVYTTGRPLQLDQPARLEWRPWKDSALAGAPPDVFRIQLLHAPPGGVYRVWADLPQWTDAQLRQAAAPPPDWTAPYLAMPDSTPQRLRDLARRITLPYSTPYAKALAIQTYLRQIPYTLELPAPPAGVDIADYFLFELRRGYCDYYATAMAALARLNGLPARLAVGYAPGRYDSSLQAIFITEADAHAWPEIYFTGLGWVRFEPTAGQPLPGRTALQGAAPALPPAPPPEPTASRLLSPWLRLAGWAALGLAGIAAAALLLAALVLGLAYAIEGWWLQRLEPRRMAVHLYRRMRQQARRAGLNIAPGTTPLELAGQLGECLLTPAPRRLHPLGRLLEEQLSWRERLRQKTQPWLKPVVVLYSHYHYSPHEPQAAVVQEARGAAVRVRRWLWVERLFK